MTANPWIPISETDPTDVAVIGNKAARLAQLSAAGIRVPDGWVLPVGADVDLSSAARFLLSLQPDIDRWVLRSSSPLEDRPDQSAAGLFASVSCESIPESIHAALDRVLDSARDPDTLQILGVDAAPIAVLAQPHLDLRGWWTVEVEEQRATIEGWRLREAERSVSREEPDVEAFALTATSATGSVPAVLEIGEDDAGLVLLQLRPAPAGAPRTRRPASEALPELPELFPGENIRDWAWDRAHCPTPLCPLLATLFARWLQSKGPGWPARLVDGRWFDPAGRRNPQKLTVETVQRRMDRWSRETRPELTRQVDELNRRATTLSRIPRDWPAFARAWIEFQERYYDGEASELRAWALEAATRRRKTPPLPATVHSQRSLELDELARRISTATEDTPRDVRGLETWLRDHPDHPVSTAMDGFRTAHGHVSIGTWDGRGPTLDEDPRPLLQEILRRIESGASSPTSANVTVDDEMRLAGEVLARCEDDDDLLARAYASFRRAARRVARALALHPRAEEDVFELRVEDLERSIAEPSPDEWGRAVRRGRGLAAHWQARVPRVDADDSRRRTGVAASGGRAEGAVRRAVHARDQGGPRPGDILVVPTIVPADAVVFGRVAGIVCEGGDALGHAAILAREFGVPAVVGIPGACRWLADAERVRVDGDLGIVARI